MNKIGAIIEARMGSSRLPGKILFEVNNQSFLKILIDRIKKVKAIDEIIVATTINKKDDILVKYCIDNNINYYRGSEEDVMGRVLESAKKYSIDTIVEITGDCPLIDPQIISQILNCYNKNNVDYIGNSDIRSYPDGMDVQVFSKTILEDSYRKTNSSLDKEHVTLHIRNSIEYSKINIVASDEFHHPDLGLTLDEKNDFIFLKKILEYFPNNDFGLKEILDLLNKNPELKLINQNVIRKGDN